MTILKNYHGAKIIAVSNYEPRLFLSICNFLIIVISRASPPSHG